MPHVDDGILHAHLDGALDALSDAGELPDGMTAADVLAHLQTCPDCSSRLRVEREMRERAGVVLADAAPVQLEMPPFPVAQSGAPARRRRAWIPMSWAASMLVALGAGWWGSEIWRSTLSNESFTVDQADRPMSAENAAGLQETTGPDLEESASTGATGVGEVAPTPPSSVAADAAGGQASASESVAGSSRTPASNTPAVSTAPAADGIVAAPPPPIAGDPASAKPADPAVAQTTRSSDVQAAPPSAAPRRESVANADVRQVRVSNEAMTIRSGMAVPLMRGAVNSLVAGVDMALVAQTADRAAFHRLLEDFEAVRFVDTDSTHVIGRPVVVFDAATEAEIETLAAGDQVVVRVRQTLATGEAVEVLSWQPVNRTDNTDPASAAVSSSVERAEVRAEARARGAPLPQREVDPVLSTLSDGRRQIIARTAGGQWIALRADLPATELRVLMSRLLARSGR